MQRNNYVTECKQLVNIFKIGFPKNDILNTPQQDKYENTFTNIIKQESICELLRKSRFMHLADLYTHAQTNVEKTHTQNIIYNNILYVIAWLYNVQTLKYGSRSFE